jgi:hypothetical protein
MLLIGGTRRCGSGAPGASEEGVPRGSTGRGIVGGLVADVFEVAFIVAFDEGDSGLVSVFPAPCGDDYCHVHDVDREEAGALGSVSMLRIVLIPRRSPWSGCRFDVGMIFGRAVTK